MAWQLVFVVAFAVVCLRLRFRFVYLVRYCLRVLCWVVGLMLSWFRLVFVCAGGFVVLVAFVVLVVEGVVLYVCVLF